jgi:hypothetical protein
MSTLLMLFAKPSIARFIIVHHCGVDGSVRANCVSPQPGSHDDEIATAEQAEAIVTEGKADVGGLGAPPARLTGSGDIVVNPGLKGDRDGRGLFSALQREVAGADQVAHLAVADPNR